MNNSVVPKSSFVFKVLDLFSLDLTHPAFVVLSYLTAIVAAGWATWKTVSIFLKGNPLVDRIMIFLRCYRRCEDHQLSQAELGQRTQLFLFDGSDDRALLVPIFQLTGRPLWMCASLLPIDLFSLKVGWILSAFARSMLI